MANLPEIRDNVVLTQMPRSSVSAADVADPFNSFAVALDGIGKAFEKEGLKDAAVKGSSAVVRDADGNLTVAENPYGGFGKMADAWERTAHMALLARGAIDDRAAAQKFALEANGNVDNFTPAWKAYMDKRVASVPEAVREDVRINLLDLEQQTGGGLLTAARKRDDQVFAADHEALAQAQRNDILALARSGGMSSRAFKTALSQYKSLRGEMIANPAFSFSKVQYDAELKQLESAATGESMIGEAERVFEKEGPRAAIELADSVLTKTDLGVSPGTARQLNGLMRGRIEDLKAAHAVDMKVYEDGADNLGKLLDAGEGINNPLVDEMADKLARGGKGAKANELRTKRTVAETVKALRAPGVTPADRVAAMEKLSAQASGGGPVPSVKFIDATVGKIRDKPVQKWVMDGIARASAATDPGLSIKIVSGGQGSRGKRTGSRRHDHGDAADIVLMRGNKEIRPDQDKALYAAFLKNAAAAGFTGLGHYGWGIHVGGGAEAVWGPDKTSKSLDPDFAAAVAAGRGKGVVLDPRVPNAEVVAATRKSINEDVAITWPSIRAGWEKYGAADGQELTTFAKQLPWVDDPKVLSEVNSFFQSQAGARMIDDLPPVEREAVISAMKGDAAGGATAMQIEIMDAVDRQEAARSAAISADAQQFSRDKYSPIVGTVPPVDIGQGVDAFGKSLDVAQRHANFLRQREGVGPVPAFTKPEAARFGQFLTTAPPEAVASVLGVMDQRLDPETFGATIDALGKSKQAKAFAAAGALQPVAPDVAASVLRGQALLAANPLLAPKETDENRVAIDKTLPAKTFVPTLEGPRQELLEAARLRYADLSAQSGDTSGDLKEERMKVAVSDVVGGFVDFNGESIIAPTYGESQADFDERIAGLTDDDLRGAIAADGTQITASDFRRYYRLKSVGDGEYAISYGGAGVPQFLLRAADPRSHSQRAFEGFFTLDLGA